jgi:hypothetical protein
MIDFHNIKSYVTTIHHLDKLNNYYDKIFCEGIFFTLEDIYKIDRIFCINYEFHSDKYDLVKANYSNFFLIPK